MKQFKLGLLLLLVVVFATACAHTNSGGMASSNLDRIAKSERRPVGQLLPVDVDVLGLQGMADGGRDRIVALPVLQNGLKSALSNRTLCSSGRPESAFEKYLDKPLLSQYSFPRTR